VLLSLPFMGRVDGAKRQTGGELWAGTPTLELERHFPTPLACGESALPIKGRENARYSAACFGA
jgi:hypothetical protein